MSTISDKKIGHDSSDLVNYYIAEVLSQNDYCPFGMMMPGRKYNVGNIYRYGVNGMEKDDEIKGEGNTYNSDYRTYDSRLGRWFAIDPLHMEYPWQSPYLAFNNNPIYYSDPTGLEGDPPKDQKVIKRPGGGCMNVPSNATLEPFGTTSTTSQTSKQVLTLAPASIRSFTTGKDRYVALFQGNKFLGYYSDKDIKTPFKPDDIIYQSKITEGFKNKLLEISDNLKHDPNKLMAIFAQETGEKFKANTKSSDGQVGLIQFTQGAIDQINKDFGISYTKAKLELMTEEDQLSVVQQYFQTSILKNKTIVKIEDYAVATFNPVNTGKPNDHVLYKSGQSRYKKNKALDLDGNGKITVGEVEAKYAKNM